MTKANICGCFFHTKKEANAKWVVPCRLIKVLSREKRELRA